MGVPEQTAFAFLSFTAESGDATAVLSRSLASYTAGAAQHAEEVTAALRALGRQFLDREGAGAWIATAAHRAGITLPAAVALERQLRAILIASAPIDVQQWTAVLVEALAAIPADVRPDLLADANLNGTAVADVASTDQQERRRAWQALGVTLEAWLSGRPINEVGAALHAVDDPIDPRRVKGAQMPRTLRFVGNAIEHDMTTVAGAAVAIIVTGAESDPEGPWVLAKPAATALARLPVAMRSGAAHPDVLALIQAGLRPRVVAHLVAQLAPPPQDEDEDILPFWASRVLDELQTTEFFNRHAATPAERAVLTAAAHVRSMA
jgi:hypothetical protein